MAEQFDPNSRIIQLCLQGMALEALEKPGEADALYRQAWDGADSDFERFIAAYFVARVRTNPDEQVQWLEQSLKLAEKSGDLGARSALPALYGALAQSYENAGDSARAESCRAASESIRRTPASDPGPFYHGTKAALGTGDLLTPGMDSNYEAELRMNHVYFTGNLYGAGLAASLARGEGAERVYLVEPTGAFEDDPNVTDKKFPGNLTRSFRTRAPLRILGEVEEWRRQSEEERRRWQDRLAKNTGEIIN